MRDSLAMICATFYSPYNPFILMANAGLNLIVERRNAEEDWTDLSVIPVKRECYARDQYFREAIWDAREVLGNQFSAALQKVTLMVVQPETFAGRRVSSLLHFLEDNQFTPICAEPFAYTRHSGREIWRYQWNAATVEKLELVDLRNCALSTVIIILRDDSESLEVPAAVRLKALKGSAVPGERQPSCLRARLRSPNRMINFVHTSDEPADFVRELGICFDRVGRRRILSTLATGLSLDLTAECERKLRRLEAVAPFADFDPSAAWARILGRATGAARTALSAQRALFDRAARIEWRTFIPLCSHVGADDWDVLTIWTTAVEHQDGHHLPLIKFDDRALQQWRTKGLR